MEMRGVAAGQHRRIAQALLLLTLTTSCLASLGDRLPDFRECVKVQAISNSALTDLLTAPGLCRGKL